MHLIRSNFDAVYYPSNSISVPQRLLARELMHAALPTDTYTLTHSTATIPPMAHSVREFPELNDSVVEILCSLQPIR